MNHIEGSVRSGPPCRVWPSFNSFLWVKRCWVVKSRKPTDSGRLRAHYRGLLQDLQQSASSHNKGDELRFCCDFTSEAGKKMQHLNGDENHQTPCFTDSFVVLFLDVNMIQCLYRMMWFFLNVVSCFSSFVHFLFYQSGLQHALLQQATVGQQAAETRVIPSQIISFLQHFYSATNFTVMLN